MKFNLRNCIVGMLALVSAVACNPFVPSEAQIKDLEDKIRVCVSNTANHALELVKIPDQIQQLVNLEREQDSKVPLILRNDVHEATLKLKASMQGVHEACESFVRETHEALDNYEFAKSLDLRNEMHIKLASENEIFNTYFGAVGICMRPEEETQLDEQEDEGMGGAIGGAIVEGVGAGAVGGLVSGAFDETATGEDEGQVEVDEAEDEESE